MVLPPALVVLAAPKLGIVIPLIIVCLLIIIAIPVAARFGKLTIPVSGCMAVGGFLVGLLVGYLAGISRLRGTTLGIALSVLFFLLIAWAVGCLLGVFFYREPSEE